MNRSNRSAPTTLFSERIARSGFGNALSVALVCIGVTGCFKVSSDVTALRDCVAKAAPAKPDEVVEIGVGPLTLHLARVALAFVDLDADARTALQTVRGAEVGVYKLRCEQPRLNYAAILSAADKTMANRGWDRVVGVMNRPALVAVYVPAEARSARSVKVCLLLVNGNELVVASARSNLEPLVELAWNHAQRTSSGLHSVH